MKRDKTTRASVLAQGLRSAAALAVAWIAVGRAEAREAAPKFAQPDNLLLRYGTVLLVLLGLWFLLYKAVYPFFLRYYSPDFCKTVFWTLFILYSFSWLLLSSYVLLEFGFYFDWTKWVAAFLGALWLIAGLVLLLRRNPA